MVQCTKLTKLHLITLIKINKMKYVIQDKEAGNIIDSFETLEEAKTTLEYYIAQDILNDIFEPDFYEIKQIDNE